MIWLIHFLPPAMLKEAASDFKAEPRAAWPRYSQGSARAAPSTPPWNSSFPLPEPGGIQGLLRPLSAFPWVPAAAGTAVPTQSQSLPAEGHHHSAGATTTPWPKPRLFTEVAPVRPLETQQSSGHLIWDLWQWRCSTGWAGRIPSVPLQCCHQLSD